MCLKFKHIDRHTFLSLLEVQVLYGVSNTSACLTVVTLLIIFYVHCRDQLAHKGLQDYEEMQAKRYGGIS